MADFAVRAGKKPKPHRSSTRSFAKKASEIFIIPPNTENQNNKKRKALRRSLSFNSGTKNEISKLERISTKLTLNFVQPEYDRKLKRRRSSEVSTVTTGTDVLNWIINAGYASTKDKAEEVALTLLKSGMIMPANNFHSPRSDKFIEKDTYIVSYPLFQSNSISLISGVISPFICNTEYNLYARDNKGTNIIIKRILKSAENSITQLQSEAKNLSHLRVTGIPPLLSVCQTTSMLIMQQQFTDCGSLFTRLFIEKKLNENTILNIIFQVASILNSLNEEGFCYGLLNLKSIYLRDAKCIDEKTRISLLDTGNIFSFDEFVPPSQITFFTPPEFFSNSPRVSKNSDMWSLGVCFYWLLFGYPPYACSDVLNYCKLIHSSPSLTNPSFEISPVTRIMLLQLLNPDPERRMSANDFISRPQQDISNLNQFLSYPFAHWRSFSFIRYETSLNTQNDSETIHTSSKKTLRSFLTRSSKKTIHSSQNVIEVGVCSLTLSQTKTFIQKINNPNIIESEDVFTSSIIDNIKTRYYALDIRSLSKWQPAYSIISHLYFLVDLSFIINTNSICSPETLRKHIKAFETLYLYDYFYDKIRSTLYNIPITITFLHTDKLKTLWNDNPSQFNLPNIKVNMDFSSVLAQLEKLFCSIKHRSAVPRSIRVSFIQDSERFHFVNLVHDFHSSIHSQKSEVKDVDSIIDRAVKLKLNRVNISFPFYHSKSKISNFPKLGEILRYQSTIKDLNLCNLSLREKDFSDFLFDPLMNNKTLISLNISHNHLGDSGIINLCKVLRNHKTLQKLIITNTEITNIGATAIGKLLQTNSLKQLELLDISHNNLGNEGIIAVSESLRSNNTLISLHLEATDFYECGFLSLCSLLEIHSMKILNIRGNIIPLCLLDNLFISLRKSVIGTPLTIMLPRLTESKIIDSLLRSRRMLYKNHKKLRFSKFIKDNNTNNNNDNNNNNNTTTTEDSINTKQLCDYITSIPQKFLDRLNFIFCKLPTFIIPIKNNKPFWNIDNIKSLNLNNNDLITIPECILQLPNLEILAICFNKLKTLGKISILKSLKRLYLCGNKLEKLSGIEKLHKLEFIDARWNQLRALPELSDNIYLEELLLDGNNLLKVNDHIIRLPYLKNLSVINNLIVPPKEIIYRAWSNRIKILDISNYGFEYIPKEISLIQSLYELNLSHNRISEIPPQLGQLLCLKILDLSYNKLSCEETLLPLLKLEVIITDLRNNDKLPNIYTNSILSFQVLRENLSKLHVKKEPLIEIHRVKLMIVGKTGVGKTVISSLLRSNIKQRKKMTNLLSNTDHNPSDGIIINEWIADNKSNPPAILSIWDMAGADICKTTHAFFLEERSIFLLVFNLSISERKQDVNYWLQMITASAPDSPIIIVGTHADLLSPDDVQQLGNTFTQKYSPKYPNITMFVSICSFDILDIETLHESILTVLRKQNFISKKVPSGYNSLINLIQCERKLCNPPFVSMKEFEKMATDCGIESSSQTVAEYLNLLGVISFFNDKKLGVSTSVVLDPAWLVTLISTIITSKNNEIQSGVLYHSLLPKLWIEYPKSLYPFLIQLFNKIELLYTSKDPHPEHGIYSLIPSTFSTNKLGAQSKFIPIDDYLALGLGTQLERIYQFEFLPFGFFSRLVVRLLHFTSPSFYWRTGLVCTSGENTGLVEFEMGRELSVKVRGHNPAKLLRVIVENIDLLLSGWYRNNATVIVPFILKGKSNYQSVGVDHQFSLTELEKAAAFGKTEIDFKEGNNIFPIRIDSIAPDLVLADISEMLMKWDDLEIEKQIGQGAFGKVYSAVYKGTRVAVKQIEVESNMKLEAYTEFRREVALCSELQQPAIVSLKGVCLDPWCLALEYMPHGDLYTFLHKKENKITWKMRITMASNIAEAVRFLHSFQPKIIHRDLKSPNCLMASIDPDAEYLVKVTDFGESRAVATSYTGRDRLHNPVWLAPEIMKKEQYTEKADVFSFGIIMWELVGRTKPFDEYDIAKSSFTYQLEDAIIEGLRPTIPKGMVCPPEYIKLMEACWNGDPKVRPDFSDICRYIARLKATITPEMAESE